MPGTYDDLWRIVLGALIGWLAFWLIDKFFRRDGEPADVDTVRALEGVDTLEAELKETADERDALRNEAEAQRAESQRLAGLLENLRESNAEQSQKITNLQAALDAAREPGRADGGGGSGGLMAGALAAGAGALAATAMAHDDDRTGERRPADPVGATDETSAPFAAQPSVAAGTDDPHDTEAPDDTLVTDSALVDDPALAIDDDELGMDDDEDWFAEDTDTFSMLDDLSDRFPELDENPAKSSVPGDRTLQDAPAQARSVMARLEGEPVNDGDDEPKGLLDRLRRAGGGERRTD